jgi:hypothetical protein
MKEQLDAFLHYLTTKDVWIEEMKVGHRFLRLLQEDIYQADAENFDKHFCPMYPDDYGKLLFHWGNKKIIIKTPENKLAHYWVQISHDSAVKSIYREGKQPEGSTFIGYVQQED